MLDFVTPKFALNCPHCNTHVEAPKGIFGINFLAKKKFKCPACERDIVIDSASLVTLKCSECGESVAYDQRQGDKAKCPVCKKKLTTTGQMFARMLSFACPQCSCSLSVKDDVLEYTCPVCGLGNIDVLKEVQLKKIAKTGLASVIKYEGQNDTFVWKHPVEDFNIGSQLIVHESQEAVFFRNGQARELFPAGRHTLETQSVPLINDVYNSLVEPSGMFHAEIYFVNLTTQMGIKWGTDSRVRFLEPTTRLPLDIGARGAYNMRVCDSRKLILKLVGTENKLIWSDLRQDGEGAKEFKGYFRSMVMTRVKTHLAKTIKENQINILEIDENLDELSGALQIRLNKDLEEYGLTLSEFYLEAIDTTDNKGNLQKILEAHTAQFEKVRAMEVRKAELEAEAEVARAQAQVKLIEAQMNADATRIVAGGTADKTRLEKQADADAHLMQAEAEAREMKMKEYSYSQETQRQIGLEAMKGGIVKEGSGGGGMGSAIGDVAGLGITLGALGGVIGLTKDALSPMMGASSDIGKMVGNAVNPAISPSDNLSGGLWDCACGQKGIQGNFCSDCGGKKPTPPETWNCACGQMGNAKNFCSNCGSQKATSWDCKCGNKNIVGNFCDNCGTRKEGTG